MKSVYVPFLLALLLLISCGDSSEKQVIENSDQVDKNGEIATRITSADAPRLAERKISAQGWVGNRYEYKSDFIEVFENIEILKVPPPGAGPDYVLKRDENDSGMEPVNRGRLRFKKDNSPYSGKIYRHFLSGEIEHFANYKNGFRDEIAYWWKKDGNFTIISTGWGYDYQEIDLTENPANPFMKMSLEMKNIDPELAETALFIGTQKEWKSWSEVNSDKLTFSLNSGVYLTGKIKIYSDEGYLDTVKHFKDGLLHGELASYHPNGTQAKSLQYVDGKKVGKEKWWMENGFKSFSANYLDDRLHGKTFSWDEQGFLTSESEFDNGQPMRPVSVETLPSAKVEQ